MSIIVRINNKEGDWIKMDRACFGFLSYINQWDEDDVEQSSSGYSANGYNGLSDFGPADLDSVDYIESCDSASYLADIRKAMAGLPQYYDTFSINDSRQKKDWEVEFNIPLSGVCMQIPVIAGMMLRNVMNYHNYKTTFKTLLEKGVEAPMAFVLAQIYPYRRNAVKPELSGFYRSYGGDETIFPGEARLCDVVNMLKGNLGDAWQGVFGDTANGYGRYGEYNDDDAEESPRTGRPKSLMDITLVQDKAVYKDSPNLNTVMFEGCGVMEDTNRVFIPVDIFVDKLIPNIKELLK